MKGNNRYGAAGRRGVPAASVAAFLDYYSYPDGDTRRRRINGSFTDKAVQRTIRRYRNGQVGRVSESALKVLLGTFGFDRRWFDQWCKLHRKPSA